jgi:hypothetical protein
MKYRTIATATMTMLGASLISFGQATGTASDRASSSATDRQRAGEADYRSDTDRKTENQAQSGQAQRQDIQALREMNWDDAQAAQVKLGELPQAVRDTFQSVAPNAQISRLSKEGQEVYRATVERANEEDLHVFVQSNGSVIKTTQQIKFSDAPASVRSAISQQLGGADAEPQALQRVIANNETSYVATSGRGGQMIRVDSSGKILDSKGQPAPGQ